MGLMGSTIVEFDFSPDSPSAIVGELITDQIVNIELWENDTPVSIATSGCTEIGTTGWYSWSTSGIPVLIASRQQFHWQMSDGVNTDNGDFVLISSENYDGGMPSLNNKNLYIMQN